MDFVDCAHAAEVRFHRQSWCILPAGGSSVFAQGEAELWVLDGLVMVSDLDVWYRRTPVQVLDSHEDMDKAGC